MHADGPFTLPGEGRHGKLQAGDAAPDSREGGAGGKSCASPAGFASRQQWGRSSKGRAEPFGDEQNNIWRTPKLAGFNQSVC